MAILVSTLSSQTASILSLEGVVQVKASENSEWRNASVGDKLAAGYFIHTGFKSTAIIQSNTIKLEVKPLTQITVAALLKEGDTISSDVLLKYGKVKADVQKSEDVKTMFKVRTANSTASVRGTAFTFGDNILNVERGKVELINDSGSSVFVLGGESAKAPKMDGLSTPYSETLDGYNVSTLPMGMSQSEINSVKSPFGNGGSHGEGSVIIKINVVK